MGGRQSRGCVNNRNGRAKTQVVVCNRDRAYSCRANDVTPASGGVDQGAFARSEVGCIMASKAIRDSTCGICLMDLKLMEEIFYLHRNGPNTTSKFFAQSSDSNRRQHCANCGSIMCLECGTLLGEVVKKVDGNIKTKLGTGGCYKQLKAAVKSAVQESIACGARGAAADPTGPHVMHGSTSSHLAIHEYCPLCHTEVRELFAEPFKNHVDRLMSEVEVQFEDDEGVAGEDGSPFVLVNIKSIASPSSSSFESNALAPSPVRPLEALELQRTSRDALVLRLNQLLRASDAAEKNADDVTRTTILIGDIWFALAERMSPIEVISLEFDSTSTHGKRKVNRMDCHRAALQCNPQNVVFQVALLANMSRGDEVVIDGVSMSKVALAEYVVSQHPNSAEAWRNAGLVMSSTEKIFPLPSPLDEATGKEGPRRAFSRNDCLQRSVHLDPHYKVGWYAAALLACPTSISFEILGATRSRAEILNEMLDDSISDDESLEALCVRHLGSTFSVFATSEVGLVCPDHPRIRRFAEQFTLFRSKLIGAGAYGQVYKAERTYPDGRQLPMAAKVIPSQVRNNTFNSMPEIHMILSHTFELVVSRAHYVTLDNAVKRVTAFLEFAEHGSMFQFMKNVVRGRLQEKLLRGVFKQVLIALRHLHYYGVVHQDIKPANLLMFDSGEVKLADFGVSCLTYCDLAEQVAGGTEAYMPPEAFNDGTISALGDMWSLAATLIELGSFHHPVPDPAHVRDADARHPYRPYIPDHFSNELKSIIGSMLSYDPTKRPSASDILDDPYFMSADLPSSAEVDAVYNSRKTESGVPQKVRDLEELSTMGISTQMLSTMTKGTMSVAAMTRIRGQ